MAMLMAGLLTASTARAELICADDTVPFGTAVTATGTAPSCDGACRAREIKPVCGMVMKICAGQPIPRGYTLDSVTSMPGCQCLGYEDDAYIIRYIGPDGPAEFLADKDPSPLDDITQKGKRMPFGNPLCMTSNAESWLSGNGGNFSPYGTQGYPPSPYQAPPIGSTYGQVPSGYPGGTAVMPGMPYGGGMGASAPPPPSQTDQEPFRIGQ